VHAIGVNPVEAVIRSGGFPLLGPPPFILGWEVFGVVERSGPGPGRFQEGDEVYGLSLFPRPGNAYAEHVAGPNRMFARKPASLDHFHAAGLPLVGLTAYQGMIEYAKLGAGQTALIHGGGGGVGHVAVQLAKAQGARVIATASAGKAAFVCDLGADEVIDYAAADFAEVVRDVDLVFDLIGGSVGERSLGVLRPGGTLLTAVQHSDPVFKARVEEAGFRFIGVAVEPDAPALTEAPPASASAAGRPAMLIVVAICRQDAARATNRHHGQQRTRRWAPTPRRTRPHVTEAPKSPPRRGADPPTSTKAEAAGGRSPLCAVLPGQLGAGLGPVGLDDGDLGLLQERDDARIVVDHDGDLALLREPLDGVQLVHARERPLAVGQHQQPAGRQVVLGQPPLGHRPESLGPGGQPHDVVRLGELPGPRHALRQRRVVGRGVEEANPVLVLVRLGDVVQPVPRVRDRAIDVEHRDRARHRSKENTVRAGSARWEHRWVIVAQGSRIGWGDLPPPVQAAIEEIVGQRVVAAESQPGGFSPGVAARLVTADGRRAFVKAVSTAQNSESPDLHRREARVTAALPPGMPAPRLLGSYDDGDWVALVLEDVEGRHPHTPWVADELDAILRMLAQVASVAMPGLPRAADALMHDFQGWDRVAQDPPADLHPWAAANLDSLRGAARRALVAMEGDTLVHLDVRADNLLIGPDGTVVLVDWPWACTGAPWLDRVLLLVNVELFGGHDTEALMRDLPGADADKRAVLAGVAGYFVDMNRRPDPPGLPTLRAFQRAQGDALINWLAQSAVAGFPQAYSAEG